MSSSDFLAIAALLVACLAAFYARGARDEARKANQIALQSNRRPLRLAVFQAMAQYSHYCSTYLTLHHMKVVNGTRDLVERIDSFKWEIEQHGHLDMPDVETKVQEFIGKAWNMQRLLDRIDGGQLQSMDPAYPTAKEHLESLVDWFAQERRELKTLFGPYLSGA